MSTWSGDALKGERWSIRSVAMTGQYATVCFLPFNNYDIVYYSVPSPPCTMSVHTILETTA